MAWSFDQHPVECDLDIGTYPASNEAEERLCQSFVLAHGDVGKAEIYDRCQRHNQPKKDVERGIDIDEDLFARRYGRDLDWFNIRFIHVVRDKGYRGLHILSSVVIVRQRGCGHCEEALVVVRT